MLNPKDIENLFNLEENKDLDPEFVAEFKNGKGDDEDGSESNIQ